jgi:hypothetical protein
MEVCGDGLTTCCAEGTALCGIPAAPHNIEQLPPLCDLARASSLWHAWHHTLPSHGAFVQYCVRARAHTLIQPGNLERGRWRPTHRRWCWAAAARRSSRTRPRGVARTTTCTGGTAIGRLLRGTQREMRWRRSSNAATLRLRSPGCRSTGQGCGAAGMPGRAPERAAGCRTSSRRLQGRMTTWWRPGKRRWRITATRRTGSRRRLASPPTGRRHLATGAISRIEPMTSTIMLIRMHTMASTDTNTTTTTTTTRLASMRGTARTTRIRMPYTAITIITSMAGTGTRNTARTPSSTRTCRPRRATPACRRL